MEFDSYSFHSNKGEVVIARNEEHPSRWDLCIDGKLIRPEFYRCPDEAALRAHQRDFGDEELNGIYVGLRVPSELSRWKPVNAFQKGALLHD